MSMGVMARGADRSSAGQTKREVPIPKKKWIKDYFTLGILKSLSFDKKFNPVGSRVCYCMLYVNLS